METIVNKHVWIYCFGKDIPCEEKLAGEIRRLQSRLDAMQPATTTARKKARSRIHNSLQRQYKMFAAVKDGQPWAWMLYPATPDELPNSNIKSTLSKT